jgi:hypothetical protein
MRVDGSELTQYNDFPEVSAVGAWKVGGRRATVTVPGRGLVDLEPDRLATLGNLQAEPLPTSMREFLPEAWSPSGKLLGGTEVDDATLSFSIGVLDPAGGTYHPSQLPMAGGYSRFAGWMPDSRHFVAVGADQIALVDVDTGTYRTLMPIDFTSLVIASLSRDARTLLVETPSADGDVWLLETETSGR